MLIAYRHGMVASNLKATVACQQCKFVQCHLWLWYLHETYIVSLFISVMTSQTRNFTHQIISWTLIKIIVFHHASVVLHGHASSFKTNNWPRLSPNATTIMTRRPYSACYHGQNTACKMSEVNPTLGNISIPVYPLQRHLNRVLIIFTSTNSICYINLFVLF